MGGSAKIRIRESSPSDNAALLSLTRAAPMDGQISLRIDREPDFYALNKLRGACTTLVAECDDQIVGCITVTYHTAFVSGLREEIGYLADFKVLPAFRGRTITYRLMRATWRHMKSRDVDLYSCVIASGNSFMSQLLGARAGFPAFDKMGKYIVYSILPSRLHRKSSNYEIETLDEAGFRRVAEFINDTNCSFLLAPELKAHDLGSMRGSEIDQAQTLVARAGDDIVATVTTFDARRFKTNVLIDLPGPLAILTRTSRLVERWIPLVHLPCRNEPIDTLYLRHVAVTPGFEDALRELIQVVRNQAFKNEYSFVTIGFHERDPRKSIVRRMPKFRFLSESHLLSLKEGGSRLKMLKKDIPVEDFALV